MNSTFVTQWRLRVLVGCIVIAFGIIGCRLFYLQVIQADGLQHIAERNRYQFKILCARRGDIVDIQGNLLATTRPMITLGLDPQMVDIQDKSKWPQLAKLANISLDAIQKACRQTVSPVGDRLHAVRWRKLAESVDDSTYEAIMKLKIKGVYGTRTFERIYPCKEHGAQALGFVNKEDQPVGGIEQYMAFYLQGQNGWIESECDGKRQELAQFRSRMVEPVDGYTVQTTLDMRVQSIVEEAIDRIVEQYDPVGVSILVGDPKTGALLALGNYPRMDPNRFWEYPIGHQRNLAITDIYEPGSVFKIVAAGGVLNEGCVSLDETWDCRKNTALYQGRVVKLPKDDHPLGVIQTSEVISKSSNRGVAQFAMRLGDDRMYQYCKRFGFGEVTHLGLVGEVKGILHPVKKWDGLTISRLPMGHAICVTPIQMHAAVSAVANNGVWMQPRIVEAVIDDQQSTYVKYPPKGFKRVIDAQAAKLLKEFMTVTTRRAMIPGIPIAGKTGTSQKIINGRYSNTQHVGSYSGFFPVDNPAVVVTIVVDDPKVRGGGYGAVVAAPAFKQIAEQIATLFGMKRE